LREKSNFSHRPTAIRSKELRRKEKKKYCVELITPHAGFIKTEKKGSNDDDGDDDAGDELRSPFALKVYAP
jgi:hypothetical protein